MGYGPPGRTGSPVSPTTPGSGFGHRPPVGRSLTGASQGTQRSYTPGARPPTSQSQRTPGPYPMGPPSRSATGMSNMSNVSQGTVGRRTPGPSLPPLNVNMSPIELQSRATPTSTNNDFQFPFSSSSTASGQIRTPGAPFSAQSQTPGSASAGTYVAFNPSMQSSSSTPGTNSSQRNLSQPRSFAQPSAPRTDYFGQQPSSRPIYPQRSGTAPPPQQSGGGYGDIYDSYAEPEPRPPLPRAQMPPRAATAAPGGGGWGRQPPQAPRGAYDISTDYV